MYSIATKYHTGQISMTKSCKSYFKTNFGGSKFTEIKIWPYPLSLYASAFN